MKAESGNFVIGPGPANPGRSPGPPLPGLRSRQRRRARLLERAHRRRHRGDRSTQAPSEWPNEDNATHAADMPSISEAIRWLAEIGGWIGLRNGYRARLRSRAVSNDSDISSKGIALARHPPQGGKKSTTCVHWSSLRRCSALRRWVPSQDDDITAVALVVVLVWLNPGRSCFTKGKAMKSKSRPATRYSLTTFGSAILMATACSRGDERADDLRFELPPLRGQLHPMCSPKDFQTRPNTIGSYGMSPNDRIRALYE
jgi:hypothetical protein